MKILLINDNPVVNKLVTLSAQKTSDELEVVSSIDSIASARYNLVVIDDTLYSDAMFTALNDKIRFDKSLYICSRDAKEVDGFSEVLKKPFLPTDLVEIFIKIGKSASDLDTQDDFTLSDEEIEPNDEDTLSESDEDLGLDDLSSDEISLDGELEDLTLDDLDDGVDDTLGKSVLDDEEAQKVKDLLDETEDSDEEHLNLDDLDDEDLELEDIDMEDDLDLESDVPSEEIGTSTMDEENLNDLDLDVSEDDNDTLEEDLDTDTPSHEDDNETVEENQDFNDLDTETQESEVASDKELEDDNDALEENLDLESQIKSAVDELSEEDLKSEVDEETLGTIVSDDLDSLTSRDLKLAVGENIEPELEKTQVNGEIETNAEEIADSDVSVVEDENSENVEGVEALKTLLTALTDKNVAASMNGMKISINITLGD